MIHRKMKWGMLDTSCTHVGDNMWDNFIKFIHWLDGRVCSAYSTSFGTQLECSATLTDDVKVIFTL